MPGIETVLRVLLLLAGCGLIFWIIWWGWTKINPPEPFKKVGDVILIIAAVIVLVNIVLILMGTHPMRF